MTTRRSIEVARENCRAWDPRPGVPTRGSRPATSVWQTSPGVAACGGGEGGDDLFDRDDDDRLGRNVESELVTDQTPALVGNRSDERLGAKGVERVHLVGGQ